MTLSQLNHAINWWKGSIDIDLLERVLRAKLEQPVPKKIKHLSISRTVYPTSKQGGQ